MSDKEMAVIQSRRDKVIEMAKEIFLSQIVLVPEKTPDNELSEISYESFRCASAFVKASELYRNGKR